MTVRSGAAGNAMVMFISSICNRSTARGKTRCGTERMGGHRTLHPTVLPAQCSHTLCPQPILLRTENSSGKCSDWEQEDVFPVQLQAGTI